MRETQPDHSLSSQILVKLIARNDELQENLRRVSKELEDAHVKKRNRVIDLLDKTKTLSETEAIINKLKDENKRRETMQMLDHEIGKFHFKKQVKYFCDKIDKMTEDFDVLITLAFR